MTNRKGIVLVRGLLCVLLITVIAIVIGNTDNEQSPGKLDDVDKIMPSDEVLECAKRNLEDQLNSDLEKGYISEFEIVSCEPYSDDREYSQNVRVIYKVRLGDTWNGDPEDETGLISLQKLSRVFETDEGIVREDTQEYCYYRPETFVGAYAEPPAPRDHTIAGLNQSLWKNPYVAEIDKDVAEAMSLEEIAIQLFQDWIDTFQEWGNNSFIITEYKNVEIGACVEPGEEENPASGLSREDIAYPGAVNTWTVGLWCDFKIIGAYDGGYFSKSPDDFHVYGGGGTFGNDGVWQDAWALHGSSIAFVLTEWEDRYTLETASTCKNNINRR